jgi:hypothetical protein
VLTFFVILKADISTMVFKVVLKRKRKRKWGKKGIRIPCFPSRVLGVFQTKKIKCAWHDLSLFIFPANDI